MKNILKYLVFIFFVSNTHTQDLFIVTKVIDGDTFVIETGERVRLLGIDTPEKWDSG